MKRLVVFALLICCTPNAFAQDWAKAPEVKPASERALKVGDRIPFTELHNVINYPKKTLKFSDHKPKLIILDFWDTRCSPCIKFWPTALKLQQEFGKDLQIIPVNNYESQREVKAFLEKRKRIDGTDMNLPMVCRDSSIWKNFPEGTYPRYVWIGADGVIGSVTYTKDVTSENIRKWITSGPFKMDQMEEKKFYEVDFFKPIFVNGNGGEKSSDVFLWSSSLTKGQGDNTADMLIFYAENYPGRGYGITITNASIFALYGHAYNNRLREWDYFDFLPIGRMELNAKDTSIYHRDGTPGGNTYNYQLICGKPKRREQLQPMMQEDLKRYFGLDVKWERKAKKCLVFTMFDSSLATKRKSLGGEAQLSRGKIILDSATVKDLITGMEIGNYYYRNHLYPIVDETGYKGVITGLREEGKASNLAEFNKALEKVGLRLKFEMREVDILVLREPRESN
jgi:thiol-disulfide isomerase/thioredoxin